MILLMQGSKQALLSEYTKEDAYNVVPISNHNRVTLTLLCWLETFDSPTSSEATDLKATLQLQSILSTTHRRDITTQCDRTVDCGGPVIRKCTVGYFLLVSKHPLNQWARLSGDYYGTHLVKNFFSGAAAAPLALVWSF